MSLVATFEFSIGSSGYWCIGAQYEFLIKKCESSEYVVSRGHIRAGCTQARVWGKKTRVCVKRLGVHVTLKCPIEKVFEKLTCDYSHNPTKTAVDQNFPQPPTTSSNATSCFQSKQGTKAKMYLKDGNGESGGDITNYFTVIMLNR